MSEHLIWRLRNNDTAKHLCGLAADEIERLRAALERVGSSEAFDVARAICRGQDDELIARIDFARSALNPSPTPRE